MIKETMGGLENLGMELHVANDYRLPTLTTVRFLPQLTEMDLEAIF